VTSGGSAARWALETAPVTGGEGRPTAAGRGPALPAAPALEDAATVALRLSFLEDDGFTQQNKSRDAVGAPAWSCMGDARTAAGRATAAAPRAVMGTRWQTRADGAATAERNDMV